MTKPLALPPSPSNNSVPRTITDSVDDVVATICRVEQVLADRGLRVHSGSSLGALLAKVRRLHKKAESLTCSVSCDHIPRRSWPLFRARAMLGDMIAGFSSPGIQSQQEQLAT